MWKPCQGWREGRRCLMLLKVLRSEARRRAGVSSVTSLPYIWICPGLPGSIVLLLHADVPAYAPAMEVTVCPHTPERLSTTLSACF